NAVVGKRCPGGRLPGAGLPAVEAHQAPPARTQPPKALLRLRGDLDGDSRESVACPESRVAGLAGVPTPAEPTAPPPPPHPPPLHQTTKSHRTLPRGPRLAPGGRGPCPPPGCRGGGPRGRGGGGPQTARTIRALSTHLPQRGESLSPT